MYLFTQGRGGGELNKREWEGEEQHPQQFTKLRVENTYMTSKKEMYIFLIFTLLGPHFL